MPAKRTAVVASAILLLAHIGSVAVFGTHAPGPLISDLIQLTLGVMLVFACLRASRSWEGLPRTFWRLTAAAYMVWLVAQGLAVYLDLHFGPALFAEWMSNLLFCFWFVPLAMAMFLDPDHTAARLDALVILDFVQAVLVCVAAYLYFFYIPKAETPAEMAHSVWAPYFVGYGFVAGGFLLRAALIRSRTARSLFSRFGAFLALSGVVDAMYFYGPGSGLRTGAWFDLLWSALLVIPLLIVVTWTQVETPDPALEPPKREPRLHSELFYLLYPVLILVMSLRIARERLVLAGAVVFLSFVCSSARLLVTQFRLERTQDALRREAARDSLTGLWNRKAILDILDRELLRADRQARPVGLIMADVDHFKAVNDSRGHVAGDQVLQIVASEIAAGVRPYDSVGRYGGEEFLIIAPGCDAAETWELAERIRASVAGCNIVAAGLNVNVTLSLGIATGTRSADSDKLLHEADTALYLAKRAGRNRVEPAVARAAAASMMSAGSSFWL